MAAPRFAKPNPMPKYELVTELSRLEELLDDVIAKDAEICYDLETGYHGEPREGWALHPETAFVVGFSFCYTDDASYYVPMEHDFYEGNVDPEKVAPMLWKVLRRGKGITHGGKFDRRHLSKFFLNHLKGHPELGEEVVRSRGYYKDQHDTFLMAYCIAETQRFGLKFLVKELYGHDQVELKELFIGLAKNKLGTIRFNELEVNKENVSYVCEDAFWSRRLRYDLPELLRRPGEPLHERFKQFCDIYAIEMNCVLSVCAMEDVGVAIDWGMLSKAAYEGSKFKDRLNQEIQEELSGILGRQVDINLTSPKQMSEMLYGEMGLRINRYTKSTKNLAPPDRVMSVDAQALETLSERLPVLKKVIQWREMKTLLTRYLTNYSSKYNYAEDGNLHPDLFAAGTVTGRFSASNPNYQQMPKRYYFKLAEAKAVDAAHKEEHNGRFPEEQRNDKSWKGIEFECKCGDFPYPSGTVFDLSFRDAIIAPTGYKIFGFDLSQAELRAIAGEANESAMMEAFVAGIDIHAQTAAMMLRKPVDQITKDDRGVGKTMNFAIVYGMGEKSLAERRGVSQAEAHELYEQYYAGFPNLKKWQDSQIAKVAHGYVYTHFGRRIPLWDTLSSQRWVRSKADRVAVNGPIQGGATGDLVKRMMAEIHDALINSEFKDTVHMVMNIHDALEFYVRDGVDLDAVYHLLAPIVLKGVPHWAPIVADWHKGDRWGSVEDLVDTGDGKLVTKKEAKEKDEKLDLVPSVDHEHPLPPPVEMEEPPVEILPPASRTVIVRLTEMPTTQRYANFMELMKKRAGENKVKLVVPEGSVELKVCSGLTPMDQQEISMIFNGARVHYASDAVDKKELLQGIGI